MVVRGDDVLGAVSWRRHETAPASHCWVLGIGLLPQARGYGYGTQAHRLLVDYLFAHTTVHRIEAATETGNIAEQKALSGPDSAAKASCAGSTGAAAPGGTKCCTASCAPIRPRNSEPATLWNPRATGWQHTVAIQKYQFGAQLRQPS